VTTAQARCNSLRAAAQRTHGGLRRGAFSLAILTYVLVFYATFLTRSGVLSSFSVHSFVEEGLKQVMTTFLGVVAIGAVAFLVWRWRDIPVRPLSESLLSRDSFFVLLILGLLVIATVVGVGTSMPVISAIPGVGHTLQAVFSSAFKIDRGNALDPKAPAFTDGRFGLVGSFYGATVPPLGLVLLALMIVGPLLGWRGANVRRLLRDLRWPAIAAVAGTCAALLLGTRDALPLAYIGLGTFAAGTNLLMVARTLKSGWLRIGGYLAHVGLALLLAGVVGSVGYASPDQKIVVAQGQTISAYGYDFTFNGQRDTPAGKQLLDFTVTRGGDVYQAAPLLYFNTRMGATMATPAIKSELLRDLYISPAEYAPPVDRNTVAFAKDDTHAIGPYAITFLGFDASQAHQGEAEIGAKLKVAYQGRETLLTPKVKLTANESDSAKAFQDLPATLPGGQTISLDNFDPVRRQAIIRVQGLNLPVDPAKAVVTVSLKPGIRLVWLGVLTGVLGGLIALLRRTLEGRALPGERRVRLPHGLGEVMRAVGGD
jgi:cytochrome c-type biogenesis protein CcmF